MNYSEKQALRKHYHQRRDTLDRRDDRSAALCANLIALPIYQQARAIHCYLATRSEVNTRPLLTHALNNHKRVVVPVVQQGSRVLGHSWLVSLNAEDLGPGIFGILQPRTLRAANPGDWDVILVPLLAFDRQGYRLGYGKGYYDRLLSAAPTPTVGLAFAAQETAAVPHEAHDIRLDWIVTEHEVIATAAGQVTSSG